jgi:hypothetical protein
MYASEVGTGGISIESQSEKRESSAAQGRLGRYNLPVSFFFLVRDHFPTSSFYRDQ